MTSLFRNPRTVFSFLVAFLVARSLHAEGAAPASTPPPDLVPDARLTAPLAVPANGEIRVAFLLSPGCEVVDFTGPWGVFEYVSVGEEPTKPFKLFTVAKSKAPFQVSGGLTVVASNTFEDVPVPNIIVVPAMEVDRLDPAALEWLRQVSGKTDVTMSVCNGSFVLGAAGLLNGKSATAHHEGYTALRAEYSEVKVIRGVRYVEDGKIATAGGLTSGVDLAFRVVERYFGRDVALQTARSLEYQGTGWMHPLSNAMFVERPIGTEEHPLCPVCEMTLSAKTDLKFEYQGKTYYFCCKWCRDHFTAKPDRYLEAAQNTEDPARP